MLERMVGSIYSSSNIYKFVDNNNNPYRNMMMDVMWMNHDYSSEGSYNILLDEESNINVAKFFELLKDYNKPLGA